MEGGARLIRIISKDESTLKSGQIRNNGGDSSVGCGWNLA